MPDVIDPLFWENAEREAWAKLGPSLIRLMMAGAKSGAEMLPDGTDILIDWDVFNLEAQQYLRRYRLDRLGGINDVTRQATTETIANWIESGEPLPVLQERLAPLFGYVRAKRISVTEVTRAYAEGNQLAWRSSGVVSEKRWMTANDERVCPLCGPLHNQVVSLDTVFVQTPTDIAGSGASSEAIQQATGLLRHNGAYINAPPRHPNCRCWLQPVVSEELFLQELDDILE